jgi:hypothetical protein
MEDYVFKFLGGGQTIDVVTIASDSISQAYIDAREQARVHKYSGMITIIKHGLGLYTA